jgi:sugar/nucleoside kinase (ribokinase family)
MEDRTILTYKGCSNDLHMDEVDFSKLDAKWFYFSSMMADSLQTSIEIAKKIKETSSKLIFNPSSYLAKLGVEAIKDILSVTDVLVFNKEESQLLTGLKDQKKIFKYLKSIIRGIIVITDGKNGATCFDGKKIYFANPLKNLVIVETTGAGDAFASGFGAGIMLGNSIENSLKMALLQSESVIQEYGAKSNILTKKELDIKIKKDKREVKVKKLR